MSIHHALTAPDTHYSHEPAVWVWLHYYTLQESEQSKTASQFFSYTISYVINNCPNDNDKSDDFASHLHCLFVVFSFYMAIQQNWNNKPNAKANNE
jgi:hypothetical protein